MKARLAELRNKAKSTPSKASVDLSDDLARLDVRGDQDGAGGSAARESPSQDAHGAPVELEMRSLAEEINKAKLSGKS